MSKKLIAVAAAAALALTALVGVAPANASAPVAALANIGAGTGETAATAATVTVERANAVAATVTGMALNLTSLATGDVVRIQTTGGVRLLEASITGSADVDVSKLGSTDINYTHSTAAGTTSTTKVYTAFTKSTATGTIVINATRPGLTYSKTLYLKGDIVVGATVGYNVTEVTGMPTTLAGLAKADITFKVTDAFGNAVENNTAILNAATTQVGGAAGALPTWDATAKVYKATITAPTSSTFIVEVRANATDPSVAGLVAANWRTIAVVNNPATAGQVATLTTQLAEANAKLAKRVTKKRFNTLARKWNAANPSAKVKLKK